MTRRPEGLFAFECEMYEERLRYRYAAASAIDAFRELYRWAEQTDNMTSDILRTAIMARAYI